MCFGDIDNMDIIDYETRSGKGPEKTELHPCRWSWQNAKKPFTLILESIIMTIAKAF